MGSEQLRLTESLLRRVIEGTEAELRVKECAAQEDELEEYVMECACDVSRLGDGHVKGDMSSANNFQEELVMKGRGLERAEEGVVKKHRGGTGTDDGQ